MTRPAVPAIVERAIALCYPARGDARERAMRAFLSLCPSERRERVAALVEAFADWRADWRADGERKQPTSRPLPRNAAHLSGRRATPRRGAGGSGGRSPSSKHHHQGDNGQ